MKTTVNFSMFCDSFSEQYKDNFTYAGKKALFEYLEQYEEETGEELECDIVAFCCDYSEYSDLEELAENYWDMKSIHGFKSEDDAEREEWEENAMEWLNDRTQVITYDAFNSLTNTNESGIIIQLF